MNIAFLAGNYYSLRGDHEKAALYFRQALRLNPRHVVSWTLLGHEYVELKNTSAAIESYRRATGKLSMALIQIFKNKICGVKHQRVKSKIMNNLGIMTDMKLRQLFET